MFGPHDLLWGGKRLKRRGMAGGERASSDTDAISCQFHLAAPPLTLTTGLHCQAARFRHSPRRRTKRLRLSDPDDARSTD